MSDCRLPDYRLPDYRRRKNISKSTRSISGRDEYTILFKAATISKSETGKEAHRERALHVVIIYSFRPVLVVDCGDGFDRIRIIQIAFDFSNNQFLQPLLFPRLFHMTEGTMISPRPPQ